jgi:hypothetical protein
MRENDPEPWEVPPLPGTPDKPGEPLGIREAWDAMLPGERAQDVIARQDRAGRPCSQAGRR